MLEDTETSSSPRAGKKCQEQVSSQESDDDGLTPKRADYKETSPTDPDPDSATEVAESQQRDTVEAEVIPASPEITFVIDDDPPEAAIQPLPPSAENDELCLGSKFWEAKYTKLKEIHDRYRNETCKELNLLKEDGLNSEIKVDHLHWLRFHDRKNGYARDPGYEPTGEDLDRDYERVSREIFSLFHGFGKDVISSSFLRASDDPEYWLIADECGHSRMKQILRENYQEEGGPPLCLWVAKRAIMRYVLRCIFEPMLVGLDKEVESHLLRVRAIMESRMVPTMADKWMSETLRSYTLLPKYDEDRNDYLRNHAKYLRNFMERFFPIPEARKHTGYESSMKHSRENIFELILKPATDFAAKLSFSFRKYEVGWDYCDKTTEIFYHDLFFDNDPGELEVLDLLGAKIRPWNFPGFGTEEKIGDVVLFVRPPIFAYGMTGSRGMVLPPLVVVKPVSGYDFSRRSY